MKKIILFLFIFISQISYSQWEITSWKSKPLVDIKYVDKDNIILVTSDEILLSTDAGDNWVKCDIGLPDKLGVKCISMDKNNIYLGGYGFLYLTTNLGKNWQDIGNRIYNSPIISSIIVVDNKIFLGTGKGIFYSSDKGETWIARNSGIQGRLHVLSLMNIKNILYASTQTGIYISFDMGSSWIQRNNGLTSSYTFDKLVVLGESVLAGSNEDVYNGGSNNVFLTSDNGENWKNTQCKPIQKSYGYLLTTIGSYIYVNGRDGFYFSTDSGDTWLPKVTGLPEQLQNGISTMWGKDEKLFISSGSELYLSNDSGNTWIVKIKAKNYGSVENIFAYGEYIFSGTYKNVPMTTYKDGLFMSSDLGDSWMSLGLKDKVVQCFDTLNNHYIAGTNGGMFISSDFGKTWEAKNSGLPDNFYVWALTTNNNNILIGYWGGIFTSSDYGNNWSFKKGLPENQNINVLKYHSNNIFAGLDNGLYRSSDFGEHWLLLNNGLQNNELRIRNIVFNDSNIFITTRTGVYYSSDMGDSWIARNAGLPNGEMQISTIAMTRTNLFIGIVGKGVFFSSDYGNTWVQKNEGINLPTYEISSLSIFKEYIFLGTNRGSFGEQGDRIYRAKLSDFGINNIQDLKTLQEFISYIYPNPSNNDLINLQFRNLLGINMTYEIISPIGNIVSSGEIQYNENPKMIILENLASGVYYIVLMHDGKKYTKKFIINK